MNNRGLLRRSVGAVAAVLAMAAGALTPAGPALAAEATQAVTLEAAEEPAIDLEPGPGNTVTIKMTNGIGLRARLNITIADKDTSWTAPAPATTATYTVAAPYGASASGVVRLQAVALKNGTEVAWGSNWTVWSQPVIPLAPVVPKIDFANYDDATLPAKTLAFSGLASGKASTTIALQRNDGGVWRTVWTSRQLAANEAWAQFTTYTFKAEGAASFRALLINAGKTLSTSPTRTLTYKRRATDVFSPFVPGGKPFSTADGRVAAKTQWSDTYRLGNTYTSRTGRLQEYRAGKWVTLQALSFTSSNGNRASVKTPLTAGTVTRKYRVTVEATAREKAWTSATSTIEHVDPARYTGYKKASYDYMKRYCPNQVLTLIPGRISYAHSPSRQIQMATGIPDQTALKFVSLHECAHILSYKVYADDYNQLTKRMNDIYGSRPAAGVEQLADCMASAMGGDIRRSGYGTKNCSGARGDAARKILAGRKP